MHNKKIALELKNASEILTCIEETLTEIKEAQENLDTAIEIATEQQTKRIYHIDQLLRSASTRIRFLWESLGKKKEDWIQVCERCPESITVVDNEEGIPTRVICGYPVLIEILFEEGRPKECLARR